MATKEDVLASMRKALDNKNVKALGMTAEQIEELREQYRTAKAQLATAQALMDTIQPVVDLLTMIGIDLDAEPADGPHEVTDIGDLANIAGLNDTLK